jgi:ryanodine receptor 2
MWLFQIQLAAFVENIRDKLAENIHEMWAVTKIETGWCFGERRDDAQMSHPCLTQFQNLPAAEKRYNIQLAVQTLRYTSLTALL